jgi:hypothetical protein
VSIGNCTPTTDHSNSTDSRQAVATMKAFLWLTLTLNLAWGSALPEPDPGLDPVPQHLSSFQVDGIAKRGGHGRPVNIDLEVWTRRGVQLQWYGEITVGTPPQKL